MKFAVKNVHSKSVQLIGGLLGPGKTVEVDLNKEQEQLYKDSDFLEVRKLTTKKKKAAK